MLRHPSDWGLCPCDPWDLTQFRQNSWLLRNWGLRLKPGIAAERFAAPGYSGR